MGYYLAAKAALESIVITEPTNGTQVQQDYGLPFSTGYVFTRRINGAQFVNGSWPIGITVEVGDVIRLRNPP